MSGTRNKTGSTLPAPKKIGLIEESAENIYSLKFVLLSIGYEVASFSYRDPYPQALGEFHPDLIIVDMMLPRGSGYSVIRDLRDGELSSVPILAVTAAAMDGGENEVLRAGASGILTKPYSVEALQDKLKEWIEEA